MQGIFGYCCCCRVKYRRFACVYINNFLFVKSFETMIDVLWVPVRTKYANQYKKDFREHRILRSLKRTCRQLSHKHERKLSKSFSLFFFILVFLLRARRCLLIISFASDSFSVYNSISLQHWKEKWISGALLQIPKTMKAFIVHNIFSFCLVFWQLFDVRK